MKCYNITQKGTEAEITMYGEVVATRPVDWWTGKPISGDFIAQDEFLKDIENLKGVTALTVRINSVGGDYYAGLAIRNRLKGLGIKVDTVNDSLAASAGSIILQGAANGGKRKVYAASCTMVHPVSGFMYGYYNQSDLKKAEAQLSTGDTLAAKCYAESGTVSEEDAKAAMEAESWMSGEEAVERGFADEVITGGENTLTIDNQYRLKAGRNLVNAAWLKGYTLPKNVKQVNALPQTEEKKRKEKDTVEIKTLNDLRESYPALVAEAEKAAREAVEIPDVNKAVEDAVKAERERMQEIDEIAGAVTDAALINDAKYNNPVSAEKFALNVMKHQAKMGAQFLQQSAEDTKNSGVGDVKGGAAPDSAQAEKDAVKQAMIAQAKKLSGKE